MLSAVRTLLSNLIDYAGTFPPASLPLESSIRNFGAYLESPERWLLGRFICPADRLGEIVPLVQEIALPDRTVSFSILGRGGKDASEFLRNIETDVADMLRFAGACPGLVALEGYEVRLPAPLFSPIKPNQIGAAISTMAFLFDKHGLALRPFVEAPASTHDILQATIMALAEEQQSPEASRREVCTQVGFKLRTGGLDASAFPTPDLVAAVIAGCRLGRVPFKATAGMHHPFRHWNPVIQARMHGFVNVFVAGCISHAHEAPVSELEAIIQEENAAAFVAGSDAITWTTRRLSTEQIAQARSLFTSFGSCSFDEPCNDLRQAGWL